MKTIYLLFTLIIFLFITSCIKKEQKTCPTDFVIFDAVVNPYDSIYHIGDTITLTDNFNYMIYEEKTNSYYNFKKFPFEAGLAITNTDTICPIIYSKLLDFIDVVPNIDYKNYLEPFSDGNSALSSTVILDGDTFRNQIKIILKRKGIYYLQYGCGSLDNKFDFQGKCNFGTYDIGGFLNYGKTNNIDLLKQSPDEHFNTWIFDQFERNGNNRTGFAYKVE